MPSRYWLVDDVSVELVDRGQLGVTLVARGERLPIPPMTLGSWEIALGKRIVTLEAKRNLDVLRYQLVCNGHLVPRRAYEGSRVVPPAGTDCSAGDGAPAVTMCPRCGQAFCHGCAPDGNHCSTCLHALVADERASIASARRIGVGSAFALTLLVVIAGAATGSAPALKIGLVGLGLTIILVIRMVMKERAERTTGLPPAVDT